MIARNEALGIRMGGSSGNDVNFAPLALYDEQGRPNHSNIAAYVALTHQRVNLPDRDALDRAGFAELQTFDGVSGYRAISLLTIPLEDEDDQIAGVLQLINARDPQSSSIIPFAVDNVVETLVLLASAALSSYRREERLHKVIEQPHIRIDQERREKQVSGITESDYFQALQRRLTELKSRRR